MTQHAPCQTCDSPVRIRRQAIQDSGSLADPSRIDYRDVRVCTDPNCTTNTRERAAGDVV